MLVCDAVQQLKPQYSRRRSSECSVRLKDEVILKFSTEIEGVWKGPGDRCRRLSIEYDVRQRPLSQWVGLGVYYGFP